MREITADAIRMKVKELFLQASYFIGDDVQEALKESYKREASETGRSVLKMIIENNEIAAKENIAICQDTGMSVLFVELGQEVRIVGGEYVDAINKGVEEAYSEGYLRKSVVDDPVIKRKNTNTNTPTIIYTDIVPGEKMKLIVCPKGFGSENMSTLGMMTPADGVEGIINFVVETVRRAGPNPCPPTIIGVGIGGTSDKVMVNAKKAITRKLNEHNPDNRYADMEKEMLKRINNLGIGPSGLGGKTTSLAVHINQMPTHIAGMPVGVNVCCHAARHAEGEV
jgi:fumarate hydratase subunit alpha